MIDEYKDGFRNSVMETTALKVKKIEACNLDNKQFQAVVEQNPRKSVKKMFQTLSVSSAIVSCHLQSIEKAKKLHKRVSHELNEHQKLRRFKVCVMLCLRSNNNSFLQGSLSHLQHEVSGTTFVLPNHLWTHLPCSIDIESSFGDNVPEGHIFVVFIIKDFYASK